MSDDFDKQVILALENRILEVLEDSPSATPVAVEVYNLLALRRGRMDATAEVRLGVTQGDES